MSGLPRTGSTLLSSILSQNPAIHSEGNSAVCQLIADIHVSCNTAAKEQLEANNRIYTEHDIISSIPDIYYKNVTSEYVFDKCRSWTVPTNINLIRNHICPIPKIIVLVRPIDEIVRSFVHLYKKNGKYYKNLEDDLLIPSSEPIMRSFYGVVSSKKLKNVDFLYINYKDLVEQTESTINDIYDFCQIERFNHSFSFIDQKNKENDLVYGLQGQHIVRPTISYEYKQVILPEHILDFCFELNRMLGIH